MTGEQIRLRGLAALRKKLGRGGLVRFLQHFDSGERNYTSERPVLLAGLTMEKLRPRVAKSKNKSRQQK